MKLIQYIGPQNVLALGGQITMYQGVPRVVPVSFATDLPEREYREWKPGDDAKAGPPILLHMPRDLYFAVFMINPLKRLREAWPTCRIDILTDPSFKPLFPQHRVLTSLASADKRQYQTEITGLLPQRRAKIWNRVQMSRIPMEIHGIMALDLWDPKIDSVLREVDNSGNWIGLNAKGQSALQAPPEPTVQQAYRFPSKIEYPKKGNPGIVHIVSGDTKTWSEIRIPIGKNDTKLINSPEHPALSEMDAVMSASGVIAYGDTPLAALAAQAGIPVIQFLPPGTGPEIPKIPGLGYYSLIRAQMQWYRNYKCRDIDPGLSSDSIATLSEDLKDWVSQVSGKGKSDGNSGSGNRKGRKAQRTGGTGSQSGRSGTSERRDTNPGPEHDGVSSNAPTVPHSGPMGSVSEGSR